MSSSELKQADDDVDGCNAKTAGTYYLLTNNLQSMNNMQSITVKKLREHRLFILKILKTISCFNKNPRIVTHNKRYWH